MRTRGCLLERPASLRLEDLSMCQAAPHEPDKIVIQNQLAAIIPKQPYQQVIRSEKSLRNEILETCLSSVMRAND
jgi:hypothetical protein